MSDYPTGVLEFASIEAVPKGVVTYGAYNAGICRMPYCYIFIKGGDQIAMVDVGYNRRDCDAMSAERFGVQNWRGPMDGPRECGVSPEQVIVIFITRAHSDHMEAPESSSVTSSNSLLRHVRAQSSESS